MRIGRAVMAETILGGVGFVVTYHNNCDWLSSKEYCKLGHEC